MRKLRHKPRIAPKRKTDRSLLTRVRLRLKLRLPCSWMRARLKKQREAMGPAAVVETSMAERQAAPEEAPDELAVAPHMSERRTRGGNDASPGPRAKEKTSDPPWATKRLARG